MKFRFGFRDGGRGGVSVAGVGSVVKAKGGAKVGAGFRDGTRGEGRCGMCKEAAENV